MMNLAQLSAALKAFGAGLGIGTERAVQQALYLVMQRMAIRVFQQGRKADATPLGRYTSAGYVAQRRKRGVQSSYVDLKFTGELSRSLIVMKTSQGWAIAVVGARNAEVADHAEARYGSVFALTDAEHKQLVDEVNKRVKTFWGHSPIIIS